MLLKGRDQFEVMGAKMKFQTLKIALFASALTLGAAQADAAIYVGSWQVDQGPSWGGVPLAYSGIEAAALLFGGSPSDYFISTVSNDPNTIDFLTWVSTWGGACSSTYPCGTQVSQSYEVSSGGYYANYGDTSAYVQDWAVGAQYTNYAFLIDPVQGVPEPATWAMMLLGFGAIGFSMRRRKIAEFLPQSA